MGRFVNDLGAAYHAGMVVIGERLGLYKALAGGAMTSTELAAKTNTDERYVREWLSSQAAGGYVTYDDAAGAFSLSDEQVFALAIEDSPAYVPGAFELVTASLKSVPRIVEAFRTGAGMGWHEHDEGVFRGCERFFRPGYIANLVDNWIPALDGVDAKLRDGATVADVGCGHGASAILLAQAYPRSKIMGFDYHHESIITARRAAQAAGVADRVQFEVASAKDFPGHDYDPIAMFDCLHDMGDPAGAAKHVLQSLKRTGHWMVVEPFANDSLADNLNPVGRVFYGASTLLCTPCSRLQEVGLCLGAQAGEARLRKVVMSAGFQHFRRAAETPFNLVFEARP
jgi:SAM-dependent methyltransferase